MGALAKHKRRLTEVKQTETEARLIDFDAPMQDLDGQQTETTTLPQGLIKASWELLNDEDQGKYDEVGEDGHYRMRQDEREFLTLRDCVMEALINFTKEDQKLPQKELFERGRLVHKIADAKEPLALKSGEITKLKPLIARRWQPHHTYQATTLLDPAEKEDVESVPAESAPITDDVI